TGDRAQASAARAHGRAGGADPERPVLSGAARGGPGRPGQPAAAVRLRPVLRGPADGGSAVVFPPPDAALADVPEAVVSCPLRRPFRRWRPGGPHARRTRCPPCPF